MRPVRSLVCWAVALEAMVCFWGTSMAVGRAGQLIGDAGSRLALEELAPAVPIMAMGLVFAAFSVACWRKAKAAQVWAMIAGGTNVLAAGGFLLLVWLPAQSEGAAEIPKSLLTADAGMLALGLVTIAAFWRWDSEAEKRAAEKQARPARIAGDGTHPLMDKLLWVVSIAGAVAAMQGWWHWSRAVQLPQTAGVMRYLAEVVIAELAMVLVHELGHAVTGQALGMRLRAFVVGPFQWRVREGRWRFQFRPADVLATGGATAVVPKDPRQPVGREIAMIAAGPAASLLGGVAALGFLLTAPGHAWAAEWRLLALFATFSLTAAVVNLLPFQTRTGYSDGAQIYQLRSGGPWGDYHRTLGMAGATTVTPLRPRDLDLLAMKRAAAAIGKGIRGVQLRLLEYHYYLDSGQMREASLAINLAEEAAQGAGSEQGLERGSGAGPEQGQEEGLERGQEQGLERGPERELQPGPAEEIPAEFAAEFVFAKAFVQRDAEGTRAWWERMAAKKTTHLSVDYWLARAASLWMEGRMTEARDAWERGNALAQRLPQAGAYEADREKFAMLRRELDAERRVLRWHDDPALMTH